MENHYRKRRAEARTTFIQTRTSFGFSALRRFSTQSPSSLFASCGKNVELITRVRISSPQPLRFCFQLLPLPENLVLQIETSRECETDENRDLRSSSSRSSASPMTVCQRRIYRYGDGLSVFHLVDVSLFFKFRLRVLNKYLPMCQVISYNPQEK